MALFRSLCWCKGSGAHSPHKRGLNDFCQGVCLTIHLREKGERNPWPSETPVFDVWQPLLPFCRGQTGWETLQLFTIAMRSMDRRLCFAMQFILKSLYIFVLLGLVNACILFLLVQKIRTKKNDPSQSNIISVKTLT